MLNQRLETLRTAVLRGDHRMKRCALREETFSALARCIQEPSLSLERRAARRLRLFLENETPSLLPGLSFVGLRTLTDFPDIYAEGEREKLTAGHFVHEKGRVCNIAYDYADVLSRGLMPRRERILAEATDREHALAAVECIDAVISFVDRHAVLLEEQGEMERAHELRESIRSGATGFWAALQTFRLLHFALWASNVYHNTIGRFDQYMYPYFCRDIASGVLTESQAFEFLEEFFLSFNLDSDLYSGMQQGDNGQSMMLGGCDAQGRDTYNTLSRLCLNASLEMRLIDPKINLRVNRETPLEVYELCTQLTRQGLGFPQYANDDVVIPALIKLGYAPEDACNYVVAACWEFIIPGCAMDIPNIGAISLASAADAVIRRCLSNCSDFEELLEAFRQELRMRSEILTEALRPLYIEPAPYASVLMNDPVHEVSRGAKYNNYGVHGTGYAVAVDQLATVKKLVYGGLIDKSRLLNGLETGFSDDGELFTTPAA